MKIIAIILVLFAIGWGTARYSLTKPVARHFGVGLLVAFAAIAVAGFFLHNAIAFLGICFVVFFIGIKTPFDAACRFLLLSVLTPNVTYHAGAGGTYLLDIHPTLVFLIGLAGCAAFFSSGRAPRRRIGAEDGVVAALVLIAILAESRTPTATALIRTILTPILALALPYWLLSGTIRDRIELRTFFGVVAGCAMILGVFSLYEAKFGWSLFDVYWANFQSDTFMSRNLRIRSGFLRTPTTFNESTAFAVFEVVGVVATLYSRRLFRSYPAWLLSCGLVGVALLAAQSRGALIGLAVGVTMVLVFRRSYTRAATVIAVAGAAVVGLLAFAKFNAKAASFVNADAAMAGNDYRQQLFSTGLREGLRHFWIGQDGDHLTARLQSLVQGEHIVDFVNTYLTFFLMSGIIGLLAFLIPLGLVLAKLWTRRDVRRTDPAARGMEVVVGSLAAILTTLIFTSFYERNPLWLIVALAASKVLTRVVPPLPRGARQNRPAMRSDEHPGVKVPLMVPAI